MDQWVLFQFVLVCIILIGASIQDFLKREVEDYWWLAMVIIGGLSSLAYGLKHFTLINWVFWGVNVAFGVLIGFLFFYLGAWGGADSKAVMALSVAWPYNTVLEPDASSLGLPLIGVLANTLFFMAGFAFFLVAWNLFYLLRSKVRFSDLEASLASKLLAIVSCVKVSVEEAHRMKFILPAEKLVDNKIVLSPGTGVLDDEDIDEKEVTEAYLRELEEKQVPRKEVWVRPLPPGIVFIFLAWLWFAWLSSPLYSIITSFSG